MDTTSHNPLPEELISQLSQHCKTKDDLDGIMKMMWQSLLNQALETEMDQPPRLWQAIHELSLNIGPKPSPPWDRLSPGIHSRMNNSRPLARFTLFAAVACG